MSDIMYIHVRRHNRNGCRKKEYFSDANCRNYALYINIKAYRNKLSKTYRCNTCSIYTKKITRMLYKFIDSKTSCSNSV